MNAGSWLRAAAVCLAVVVFGVCWLLVPAVAWTNESMGAAALLAISIALPLFIAGPAIRSSEQDATAIWSIGPTAGWWILLLATAAASLAFGISGASTLTWVAILAWAGIVAAGWLLLRAGTRVVERAAAQTLNAAADPRTQWSAVLRRLELAAEDPTRVLLADLRERIRFAANERGRTASMHVEAISAQLARLEAVIARPDDVRRVVADTRVLLDERESALRSARSKA